MDDRQLLEAAARAFWGDEIDDVCSICWSDADGILYTHADNQDHNGRDVEYRWNPLEESHDAFELAVKLNLTVRHYMGNTCAQTVTPGGPSVYVEETDLDDPLTAARRAIVKAAAAIGAAASRAKGV